MEQAVSLLNGLINAVDKTTNEEVEQNKEIADENYMKKIWSKYESIHNSYNKRTVEWLAETGHTKDDILWCASEKVHGANFSLITNGVDIIAGSRTQILNQHTKFYGGWRDIVQQEKERVIKAFHLLNKRYNNKINVIIIYGEFFGGDYSHHLPQYRPKNKKCIQKGVFYSPNLHFYAFDIKTDLEMRCKDADNIEDSKCEEEEEEEIDGRLTVKEAVEIFEECGFLHAKVLKIGTFDELLAFDVDHLQSTIPSLLKLPQPQDIDTKKEIDNIAEGVVIRKYMSKEHQLLKIKAKRFLEIEAQAKIPKKKKPKNVKNDNLEDKLKKMKNMLQGSLKEQTEEIVDFSMRCINDARLASVESKIGKMSKENVKKIQGLLMNDVFQELNREKVNILKDVDKKTKGKIRAFIAVAVQLFFKPKIEALQQETN